MKSGIKKSKKRAAARKGASPGGVAFVGVLTVGLAGALVVLAKLGKLGPLLKLGTKVGGTLKKATGATEAATAPVSSHVST